MRASWRDGVCAELSTSNAKAEGRYDKQDFVYKADEDVYLCPAASVLTYRFTNEEDGKVLRSYWTTACSACPLKEKCTTGRERRIKRWEHEAVLEAAQDRLDRPGQDDRTAQHAWSMPSEPSSSGWAQRTS